jgi:putative DNA primase/helicase
LQQFPDGIGARYIGEDRLLQEITRSASKYGIATPVVVQRTPPPEDDPELADDPELQDDPELVVDPAPPQAKEPTQPAQPAEPEHDPELDDDDDLDDDDAGADPGQFAEPKPLPEGLAPVPPFDMKFLPEAWVPWIGNMAENMQCPPDYATISVFVGLGSLIGRRVSIRPKSDWNEYANLWGLFIGSPAMMKSPSMMKALAPIHRLEAEAARDNEVALEAYKVNLDSFKLRQKVRAELEKAALKKGKAADINADLLGCEPEEPKPVRYRTNDTSYEKLGELLIDNPNGLLIERDELISLLRHLDREEQGVARGFYMSGWSGSQSYVFDRIGRGHLHIPAVCLSVLGNTQPARISEYVRRANLGGVGGDGLIQRFSLMVWPDVSSNFQNRDEPLSADAKDRAWNVFNRISELTETNLCAAGARRAPYDDTPYLCFDSAARSEFMGWYEDLERRLRGSGLSPALQGHLGKYRTLVPALALIYHLVEGVEGQVGLAALRKAVAFSRYLESHAHRIYGAVDLVEVTAAKAILARIRDGQLPDSFTARIIHQHRWSDLAEHAVVQAGLALLVEFDYLVAKQAPISQSGGRPKITYTINPAVRGGA